MLNDTQQKKLLKLAREAITSIFDKKEIDDTIYSGFKEKRGAFVTLKKKDELRGCIGYVLPYYPLWQTIANAAKQAAFGDPRFEKLEKDELKGITIEISVLTVPEQIKGKDAKEIKKQITLGRDGLIIETDHTSGLLLPQVATEFGWGVTDFLENTCQKAGLPKDAWLEPKTKIYRFQAEIFCEK